MGGHVKGSLSLMQRKGARMMPLVYPIPMPKLSEDDFYALGRDWPLLRRLRRAIRGRAG